MNEEATTLELQTGLMPVQCCVCKVFFETKPGPLNSVSHGYCEKCLAEALKALEVEDAG